jgi:hypothetical protein
MEEAIRRLNNDKRTGKRKKEIYYYIILLAHIIEKDNFSTSGLTITQGH